jgi:hypothetical protein
LFFRNRVINGDMRIDQRNAGASVSATDSAFSVDRFSLRGNATGKYTAQRNAGSVTPPPGFTNYLGITSTSAYTPSSGDYIGVQHKIEGYNVADFDLGKSTAKTWTLSFWVRSSLTGNFGATYRNSAQNRSYAFTYTINQANTWEKKTITTVGDTTGTWLTDNGVGLDLWFNLGSGSANSTATTDTWQGTAYLTVNGTNNLVSTSGATWYVTGVQLEAGTAATAFERRPYTTELQLCQRYCIKYGGNNLYEHVGQGNAYSTSAVVFDIMLPTTMRTSPSYTVSGNWIVQDGNTNTNVTGFGIASGGSETSPFILAATAATGGGLTQFRPYFVCANNSLASSLIVTAEL